MTTQLRLQMDDLILQDDALKATHQRAEYNQWAADHADELYEGWLDARYEDWAAQQEAA